MLDGFEELLERLFEKFLFVERKAFWLLARVFVEQPTQFIEGDCQLARPLDLVVFADLCQVAHRLFQLPQFPVALASLQNKVKIGDFLKFHRQVQSIRKVSNRVLQLAKTSRYLEV